MSKLALISLIFLQIQVSSKALNEGRPLRGGCFVKEVAAQQQTIPPEQWEARKFVRYLGEVHYTVTSQSVQAKPAPARAAKPQDGRGTRPPHPRARR